MKGVVNKGGKEERSKQQQLEREGGRRDPTSNTLLINFLLSSDAEILLISTD